MKRILLHLEPELCHEKMCLKIFVIVIPKEGLPGRAPSILFGYDIDYKLYSAAFTDYILQSVSCQEKDQRGPTHQSLFWYDNDNNLKAHFLVKQLNLWSGNQDPGTWLSSTQYLELNSVCIEIRGINHQEIKDITCHGYLINVMQ